MSVRAEIIKKSLPTYPLGMPEKNPMFFERRVYQGSNGKVYPVPFIDKVFDEPVPREYQVVVLENDYVYLELLPEIGGRIFKGQDKTNRNYDFFYRQDVIKPALVGLAGPWISGGVEFNWPQHHRPGTYMPADVHIEEEADGARTVWMSEHDPLERMKGMHGVRLRPDSSLIELRVRLFNRTPITQTFLWWANVAAQVHDEYQSFFPPDVHYVADHAVRDMSSFPEAENTYYGIDYAKRPGSNDLTWYRNIPVPTSYMVCESEGGFFGGYDYSREGGFVHFANPHLSPGKKQWTWGNHDFGRAWDRELTDQGGSYVELMAGVYTDNQPDFSYLLPYETKTFSQFWWPLKELGPVQFANEEIALRLVVRNDGAIDAGVNVSRAWEQLSIRLSEDGEPLVEIVRDLGPGSGWRSSGLRMKCDCRSRLELVVKDFHGRIIGQYRPSAETAETPHRNREQAREPGAPEEVDSIEALYLIGEHLEQYRHPTRDPELYWNEALKRDPGDARSNLALGKIALRRGEFDCAKKHFDKARVRLTAFHPNPSTGEAHYYAGLCRRYLDEIVEAYALFYKATWNFEWKAAASFELACIDFHEERYREAKAHAQASLEANALNNKAVVLYALSCNKLADREEAVAFLEEFLRRDPLDAWAQWVATSLKKGNREKYRMRFRNDTQTMLDVAFDFVSVGAYEEALDLLEWHRSNELVSAATSNSPQRSQSVLYLMAWIHFRRKDEAKAAALLFEAEAQRPDYFFPSRLDEQIVLEWAMERSVGSLAPFALGNYCYDKRRHADAMKAWECAVSRGSKCPTVFRNLGIAYWNGKGDGKLARASYEKAIQLDPEDARLLFEFDQLRKKLGEASEARLETLERRLDLVHSRDDLCVEYATLLNDLERSEDALNLLLKRRFHPWEGGEGKVLRQYTRARIDLGRNCLERARHEEALFHFENALLTPENLGEAYHPLRGKAEVNYWMGKALSLLEHEEAARDYFEKSAAEACDFEEMAVVSFSESSRFQALSLLELGRIDEARALFQAMLDYADGESHEPAKIDYFATSLPQLLVFEDDLERVKNNRLETLRSIALFGLENLRNDR